MVDCVDLTAGAVAAAATSGARRVAGAVASAFVVAMVELLVARKLACEEDRLVVESCDAGHPCTAAFAGDWLAAGRGTESEKVPAADAVVAGCRSQAAAYTHIRLLGADVAPGEAEPCPSHACNRFSKRAETPSAVAACGPLE